MICFIATLTVYGEVKAPFTGTVGSQIRYTPENKFESGYHLELMNPLMTSNNNLELKIGINSLRPKEERINFPFERNSTIPLYIHQVYIRTKTPLIPSSESGVLTIGNVWVDYSPYTISLRGGSDSRSTKGLSLDKIRINDINLDGFLVWIDDLRKPLYGFKFVKKGAQNQLIGTYSQHIEYLPSGLINNIESMKSIEIDRSFKSGKFSLLYALQERNDTKEIKQASLSYDVSKNVIFGCTWRDFEPGYKPLFSDGTDRYDSETGQPKKWNPVDKYAGWYGISTSLEGRLFESNLKLLKDIYLDRDYYRDQTLQQALISREEVSLAGSILGIQGNVSASRQRKTFENNLNTDNCFESSSIWGSTVKQFVFRPLVLSGKLKLWYDNGTELIDNNGNVSEIITEKGKEIVLSTRIRKGLFRGITMHAGIKAVTTEQSTQQVYKSIGLDYRTRAGIEVLIRMTTPNYIEPDSYVKVPAKGRTRFSMDQYNRFGEKVVLDNIFQIKYSTDF